MRDKTPREALPRHRAKPAPPGPVPTVAELGNNVDWFWVVCGGCNRFKAVSVADMIARLGPDASSNVIRRNARCTVCGHKGASLQHPSAAQCDKPMPRD